MTEHSGQTPFAGLLPEAELAQLAVRLLMNDLLYTPVRHFVDGVLDLRSRRILPKHGRRLNVHGLWEAVWWYLDVRRDIHGIPMSQRVGCLRCPPMGLL